MTGTETAEAQQHAGQPMKVRKKSRSHARRRLRRRLLRLALAMGIIALTAGACAAWLAHRADQVKTHLEATAVLLPAVEQKLLAGDVEGGKAVLEELQDHATAAREAGTDPLWKAASSVPRIGANFSAVTAVTKSADDVVQGAVAPLVSVFGSTAWEDLAPKGGKIDAAALRDASPALGTAARTVQLSYERLTAIDQSALLPQIAGPLGQAITPLNEARGALNAAAATAKVLPPMLGMDGPRNYLILIQNSAEVRATGGIPGAVAVISADRGTIKLAGQASAGDVGVFDPPLDVPEDQERIFTTRLGTQLQNVNLTPDFPTAASTARSMWEKRNPGVKIDGVIALDPVVLANVLRATGPVALKDPAMLALVKPTVLPATLTAENAVKTLLSDSYAALPDPGLQDDYFALMASEVFTAVADGQGDGKRLVEELVRSSEQNRLYVWSARPDEQRAISTTAVSGMIAGSAQERDSFGLYFNDSTGAKMDYYVRRTAQLVQACMPDGGSAVTLRVTLTNAAPADAAGSLPKYVTGQGVFGVDAGRVRTNVVAYGPGRSLLEKARLGGDAAQVSSFRQDQRPVAVLTAEIGPGETETVEIDFSRVAAQSDLDLNVTPTIQPVEDVVRPPVRAESCPAP
ncbi:DUF4012 domain-containing protein [Pseudarthrobacter sp. C1]|uniref:DUF4012 domain-containing protein n=1 Tax=Pseudarthrobacter sp. C1 TaxID=3108940 RepID=UPI002B051D57|nr:DUF4012 domain-containing protein [Pseudarthrobacter sp. C1]MEA3550247.1 DUF4012 domain-containing protein [Pseudarthrobacter sp. C1]